MSKFKAGDKVIRVRRLLYGIFENGRAYTVSELDGESWFFLEGVPGGSWSDKYFTLAKPAATPKTTYTPERFEEAAEAFYSKQNDRLALVAAFEAMGLYPEEPQRTLPAEDGVILWFPYAQRVGCYHDQEAYWSIDGDEVTYLNSDAVTSRYGDDWVVVRGGE